MSPDHPDACPMTREVLSRIGDKWSVLVIVYLRDGAKRFSELRKTIEGISQRMLTLTLRGLERDGMVTRTQYPTIPPRVDYKLTHLGITLIEPILALHEWANSNRFEIQRSRERYDARNVRQRKAAQAVLAADEARRASGA